MGICRGIALLLLLFTAELADSKPLGEIEPADSQERLRRQSSVLASAPGILNEGLVPLQDCKAQRDDFDRLDNTDGVLPPNGLYKIFPGDEGGEFTTFCDMQMFDGGGWTIIQRRVNGDISFNRTWSEYENGFGDLHGNFWLGLRKIKRITDMGKHQLYIGLTDDNGNTAHALYKEFGLRTSTMHYELVLGDYIEGDSNAGNSLKVHNGQPFSTAEHERDHDDYDEHCAQKYGGGWWFKECHYSNLNGIYYPSGRPPVGKHGIQWQDWLGDYKVAVKTVMAVRRV